MALSPPRWSAVVHYRSEAGLVDVEHLIEELGELELLVEHGPDWDTIEKIEIVKHRKPRSSYTIEQASAE